ncbi:MAG TPA: DUF222 domain-containing protein, partial [Streptosporangiaceae bacterium]
MCSVEPGVPAATIAQVVAGIAGLAAELAAGPVPDSGAVCYEQTETLGRAVDLLESAIAVRVAAATRAGTVAEWGHTSPAAWLRTSLGMRHARAEDRAVLAEQLPRLPQVAERLAVGELSAGYAVAIAGGVRRLEEADCGKAERLLLGFVDEGHSVGQIIRFADKIKDLIAEREGTAVEPEDGRRAERQWLAIHRSGSGGFVKGRFGAELMALIKARLEPLAQPCGADDTRDHAERLADALQSHLSGRDSRWDPIVVVNLQPPPAPKPSAQWTAAPASDRPARSPQVPVDAGGDATSAGQQRRRPYDTRPQPRPGPTGQPTASRSGAGSAVPGWPFSVAGLTARLADGTPIPAWRARQILLNAGFSALVLGADGLPLYLGRRVRCASPAQRRVVLTRYATCVVDGCEIPATACQIDHIDGGWEAGQPTDI